jgi:hypothetical protein
MNLEDLFARAANQNLFGPWRAAIASVVFVVETRVAGSAFIFRLSKHLD